MANFRSCSIFSTLLIRKTKWNERCKLLLLHNSKWIEHREKILIAPVQIQGDFLQLWNLLKTTSYSLYGVESSFESRDETCKKTNRVHCWKLSRKMWRYRYIAFIHSFILTNWVFDSPIFVCFRVYLVHVV